MKKMKSVLIGLVVLYAFYFIGTGFMVRSDVGLVDFVVSPDESEMTISVGVIGSIGYIRHLKNVSDDPEKMHLKVYSAFGGINGSIGAENRFVLPLSEECKKIYLYTFGDYMLVIEKDEVTGEWKKTNWG